MRKKNKEKIIKKQKKESIIKQYINKNRKKV